jgi:hypothetical protein
VYPDLFNDFILQETTHHPIQIKSMGMTSFEVLDGGNVHMEYKEVKASSYELINSMHYHFFSWHEGNVVVDVYQTMSSSSSSSFMINSEDYFSSIPISNIVDVSGFHHCIEYLYYTMVGTSPCMSFHSTSICQVDGFLKYETQEACQEN